MRQSLFGPLYTAVYSLSAVTLSLSLISPLVRASILSDLCVNFFYGCLFHSLSLSSACPGCFTEWYQYIHRDKCWMLSGKWRLNNYTNRDPTFKRVHIQTNETEKRVLKTRRGLLTSGWRARLSRPTADDADVIVCDNNHTLPFRVFLPSSFTFCTKVRHRDDATSQAQPYIISLLNFYLFFIFLNPFGLLFNQICSLLSAPFYY